MQTSLKEPRNYAVSFNKETLKKDIIKTAEEAGFLEQVSFDDLTSHPTTIAGYGITDAYILNGTIYLGNQSITPESVSNLGTAAYANVTNSVSQGSLDLPTSGAVYSAIAAAVSSALHFRGISSTALTDGGTETATIGGVALVPQDGDVVIYDGFEFLWESNQWNKLGDDTSYALKTIQIAGDGTYITGGGDLTSSRTLDLSQAVKDALALASTAYQKPSGGIPASDLAEAYLPLTAGSSKALTGKLYMSAQTAELISSYNSDSFKIFSYNQSTLDVGGTDRTKGLRLNGSSIVLQNGGTNTIRFASTAFRPTDAANSLTLGNSTYKWSALYATTLYGDLDLSYLQNADDLKAIEALTGTGFAKRTADNTWALTNDIEANALKTTIESDASFTYRKTPNTAVGDTLKIKRILGKTIVWNQIIDNTAWNRYLTTDSYVTYSVSGTEVSMTQVSSGDMGVYQELPASLNGHQIYIAYTITAITTMMVGLFRYTTGSPLTAGATAVTRNAVGRYSQIVTPSLGTYTKFSFGIGCGGAGNSATVKDIVCIDLTAAFGSGFEPTLEQFESWYYKDYFNHDSGSLQSNRAASIETTGFNQWDEEWERGGYNTSTGEENNAASAKNAYIRSKNAIPSFPSIAYYIKKPANVICRVLMYDAEGNYISYYSPVTSGTGASFTTNANTHLLKIYFAETGDYQNNICINFSDPSKNGTYEPYHKDTLTLNLTSLTSGGVAVCPEGLKAADYAGTVCDETDGQVLVQRVGTRAYQAGDESDQDVITDGTNTNYALATPQTYVLDTPIPMLVASDVNGTQRRLPEDTENSVQAPFRADFQYGVNPDDIIQDLNTQLQDLDNRYLPANALSNVTDITGTGLLTMPRAAISDSLLVPTLCRQQQGDVILEWYEAKASLYVKENDLTLHIVLNGNDYSLNLN